MPIVKYMDEVISSGKNLHIGDGGGGGGSAPFIVSSYAQRLTLPLYSDDAPIIEFDIIQSEYQTQALIIGDEFTASGFLLYTESNYFALRYSSSDAAIMPHKALFVRHVVFNCADRTCTVDGVVYGGSSQAHLHLPVSMFGLSNGKYSCIAVGEIKAYVNNSLVMDLKPMQDAQTGAGYYHDTIGNTDYYSETNTDFLYEEFTYQ